MKKQKQKYMCILIISQILICLAIGGLITISIKNISNNNNDTLRMMAISNAEETMKKVVENTIVRIEYTRETVGEQVSQMADLLNTSILSINEDNFTQELKRIVFELQEGEYGRPIQVIVYDTQLNTMKLLKGMETIELDVKTNSGQVVEGDNQVAFYKYLEKGTYKIWIYAQQQDIDLIVKTQMHKEIHNSVYDENEYIWVNEILDYNGGDNYAIRVIHPNLKETEGKYLSTYTKDLKGNYPFLQELKGIKAQGELFHVYYFKNKSSDEVTEKLSYAKLYKPLNWVVSTGNPLNDILSFSDQLESYNKDIVKNAIIIYLILTAIIFSCGILIIIRTQKKYQKKIDTYIKTETETDVLTGALNRKMALVEFDNLLEATTNIKTSTLLLMMDIDNFKKINDTYGHDVGDLVLKKVVEAITSAVRGEDKLFRWGGEEFILVCNDKEQANHINIAEKILCSVNSLIFEYEGNTFNVSVSIGGTHLHLEDREYNEAVKRADQALYYSKRIGKNKYTYYKDLNR
ncbi:MAG: diguanylate cyclase [Aminipila sp.]